MSKGLLSTLTGGGTEIEVIGYTGAYNLNITKDNYNSAPTEIKFEGVRINENSSYINDLNNPSKYGAVLFPYISFLPNSILGVYKQSQDNIFKFLVSTFGVFNYSDGEIDILEGEAAYCTVEWPSYSSLANNSVKDIKYYRSDWVSPTLPITTDIVVSGKHETTIEDTLSPQVSITAHLKNIKKKKIKEIIIFFKIFGIDTNQSFVMGEDIPL